ncbi:unnamed protein product [Linum tenue]|uniref:Uncharacterized protein n=1 Tax=Linum tenue TaxID=586396 RepID=A0AAV0PEK3_9ROSI|nr:unnamed protein product [Linum tenue]
MENTAMKLAFFFALLFFTAGLEKRVADGRGLVVDSFKCKIQEDCYENCKCQICACEGKKCICKVKNDNSVTNATANSTPHQTIDPPSLTY